jgi:hypothetical protein
MSDPAKVTGVIVYLRAGVVPKAPSATAQRRVVEAWTRRTKTRIAECFVDKTVRCPIEERPGLIRALAALGPESRILCVARPPVLHDVPWVRTLVEHLAVYAGGRVSYASSEGVSDYSPPQLDQALDIYERMLLRLQVMRGAHVKKPGDAVWGPVPWGYRLAADGMSLEPNNAEQAVVSVIRHMRERGLKLREIKDELRTLGVVSRTGKPFGITRIYELLDQGSGSRMIHRAEVGPDDAPPESVVRTSPWPESDSGERPMRGTHRRHQPPRRGG